MPSISDVVDGVIAATAEQPTPVEPGNDVNAEAVEPQETDVAEEAVAAEAEEEQTPETEEAPKPGRANERIRELVAEKNQYAELVRQQQEIIAQLTGQKEPPAKEEPSQPELADIPDDQLESEGERWLAKQVRELKAKLAEVAPLKPELEEVRTRLQTKEQADAQLEAQRQCEAAFNDFGITDVDEQSKIIDEAAKYANIEGLTVKGAIQRAMYYLRGTGAIKVPAAPSPLKAVTEAKKGLAGSAPSQGPAPLGSANIEKVSTIDEALAVAARRIAG